MNFLLLSKGQTLVINDLCYQCYYWPLHTQNSLHRKLCLCRDQEIEKKLHFLERHNNLINISTPAQQKSYNCDKKANLIDLNIEPLKAQSNLRLTKSEFINVIINVIY